MKVVSTRQALHQKVKAAELAPIPEKKQEQEDQWSHAESMLSKQAQDYLDDIFGDLELEQKQEPASEEQPQPIAPSVVSEVAEINHKENNKSDQIEKFLDKSVVKKKVRFSSDQENEKEDEAGQSQEESDDEEGEHVEQAEEEPAEERSNAESSEPDGSQAGDLPFEEDDDETIQQILQEHMAKQSSLAKLLLLCTQITSPGLRQLSKPAKDQEDMHLPQPVLSTASRDFFKRQLSIYLDKALQENQLDLAVYQVPQRIQRRLDLLIGQISLPTFTIQLSDKEWKSMAKVFTYAALQSQVDPEHQDESLDLLAKAIKLDDEEMQMFESLAV